MAAGSRLLAVTLTTGNMRLKQKEHICKREGKLRKEQNPKMHENRLHIANHSTYEYE